MKISHETLYSLRDIDFKLLHYTMKTHFHLYDSGEDNLEVSMILGIEYNEFISSLRRLQDLGYIVIFNGIVFTNNLEIV